MCISGEQVFSDHSAHPLSRHTSALRCHVWCQVRTAHCVVPIVVCLEIYSDIDIHPHLSDLDQKTPCVVAAGSAHCVYLTGMTFIFVGMKRKNALHLHITNLRPNLVYLSKHEEEHSEFFNCRYIQYIYIYIF